MTNDKEGFQSITYGKMDENSVARTIVAYMEADPKTQYSLVIGSDSHERKEGKGKKINVVTAIVARRIGRGAIYFWIRHPAVDIYNLKDKINKETMASLELAGTFTPILNQCLNGEAPKFSLEIHVDIGRNGETRDMIKEIVGMVNGNGFVAKTKPEAYGATYIADKHT